VYGSARVLLRESAFLVFSRWLVFSIFLSFLLPVWSLSFATEALGGDREHNSLVWLLTRPLPRPAIYLGKFVALLPWSFGLNVAGFAVLCLAGGEPGLLALRLFWPAVVWATLAFSALFYLTGAYFRRPAVVALVYSFFLETLLGNMPGYLKRVSIGFYARCMMFEAAQDYGVQPEKPSVFLPVDGTTALIVLVTLTVSLLALGAVLFSRSQYHEIV
jgi:ABC-2 type transport system permease protein